MKLAMQVGIGLAQTALLIHVAYSLFLMICRPAEYLAKQSRVTSERKEMIRCGALMFGLGMAVFYGAAEMLSWIPYSIGSRDEFGDFHPIRDTLASMIALGSVGLLSPLEELAKKRVALDIAVDKNKQLENILVARTSQLPGIVAEYQRLLDEYNPRLQPEPRARWQAEAWSDLLACAQASQAQRHLDVIVAREAGTA